ncbi:MAG: flippase [Chitinophagales bacterium]|nr:flippase [Chitinophagales bacterium]
MLEIKKIRKKLQQIQSDKNFSFVLKGSAFTAFSLGLVMVLRFVSSVIISRKYGAAIVGQLGLVTLIQSVATILCNVGLKDAMLKFIPQYREKFNLATAFQVYKKAVWMLLGFSIIGTIVVYFGSPLLTDVFWEKPEVRPMAQLSAAFLFFFLFNELNNFTLRAILKVKNANYNNITTVAIRVMLLIILTWGFYNPLNPIYLHFIAGGFIAAFVSFLPIYRFFYKPAAQQEVLQTVSYKEILKVSFPMLLTYVSFMINDYMDVFMLGKKVTDLSQLGVYRNCQTTSQLAATLLVGMNTTIQPKISQLFHRGELEEVRKMTQRASKFIFLANIPVFLILIFGSKFVMSIYGKDFISGYLCLSILTIGQVVNTATGPVAQLLNVTGNHKKFRDIAFVGAMIKLVLNIILIPFYGVYGAAIASVISMSTWNIMGTIFIRKKFGFYIAYFPFLNLHKPAKS